MGWGALRVRITFVHFVLYRITNGHRKYSHRRRQRDFAQQGWRAREQRAPGACCQETASCTRERPANPQTRKPAHADRKHRAQESVLQAAREAASSANRHLLLGYRRKTRTPPLVPQAAFCLELSRQLHRQSLICSITNQVTPRSAFSIEPQQRDLAALPPPTLRLPPPGAAHAPAVPSSRRGGQWPAGQRCQKMAAARARGHRGRHRRAGERPGRFVWR